MCYKFIKSYKKIGEGKMLVCFKGELRNVVKGKEFSRKDGTTGCNVNVSVEVGGVPQYFASEEPILARFNRGEIEKGKDYVFVADYNPRWKFNQFVVKEINEVK